MRRFVAHPAPRRRPLGLLVLAAVAPIVASCDFRDDGLVPMLTGPGTSDGSTRDTMATVAGDARLDGSGPSIDPRPVDGGGPRADGAADRPAPRTDAGATPRPPPPIDAGAPPPRPPVDAAPPPTPPPVDAAPVRQVLLLVGAIPLSAGDMALATRLMALGYRVENKLVINPQQAEEVRAAAVGFSMLVLSSSLPQVTGLPRQVRDMAIPILCTKAPFYDNLGIGVPDEHAVASGETELQIRAPNHPMAAGRSGIIAVVNQARPFSLVEPVPAAIVVATIAEEADEAVIFGLEKGAADRFGPAPARRVGWFAQEPTFLALNATGVALFEAAVRWLAGTP